MATWKDVKRIALALPETSEQTKWGTTAWCVRDKMFVWERPLRKSDLEALGDNAPKGAILGVRVAHLLAKEALLAARPDVCFTTPHFNGYPAILVQLGKVRVGELRNLIQEAWEARATSGTTRSPRTPRRRSGTRASKP
ncbi:MAG TPA: MmcQ/YjbR family DNA-binding protein [Candidatus Polarisedimenticolaceae bacterium]|nr:MmcQ/YjbR family DNA-binding protein [Candidatus Polarisedimenticolaceae bacterium]